MEATSRGPRAAVVGTWVGLPVGLPVGWYGAGGIHEWPRVSVPDHPAGRAGDDGNWNVSSSQSMVRENGVKLEAELYHVCPGGTEYAWLAGWLAARDLQQQQQRVGC